MTDEVGPLDVEPCPEHTSVPGVLHYFPRPGLGLGSSWWVGCRVQSCLRAGPAVAVTMDTPWKMARVKAVELWNGIVTRQRRGRKVDEPRWFAELVALSAGGSYSWQQAEKVVKLLPKILRALRWAMEMESCACPYYMGSCQHEQGFRAAMADEEPEKETTGVTHVVFCTKCREAYPAAETRRWEDGPVGNYPGGHYKKDQRTFCTGGTLLHGRLFS